MDKEILYNAIETPDGTVLVSKHRHDYVSYTDKNGYTYVVDGGRDYLKRSMAPGAPPYKDLTVYDDGKFETRRKYIYWGSRYDKDGNLLPQAVWKPIMELSIEHIEAIIDTQTQITGIVKDTFVKEFRWRKRNNTINKIISDE
jgi:hypothetical protein